MAGADHGYLPRQKFTTGLKPPNRDKIQCDIANLASMASLTRTAVFTSNDRRAKPPFHCMVACARRLRTPCTACFVAFLHALTNVMQNSGSLALEQGTPPKMPARCSLSRAMPPARCCVAAMAACSSGCVGACNPGSDCALCKAALEPLVSAHRECDRARALIRDAT